MAGAAAVPYEVDEDGEPMAGAAPPEVDPALELPIERVLHQMRAAASAARALMTYASSAVILWIWFSVPITCEPASVPTGEALTFLRNVAAPLACLEALMVLVCDFMFFLPWLQNREQSFFQVAMSNHQSRPLVLSPAFVFLFSVWSMKEESRRKLIFNKAQATFEDIYLHGIIYVLISELPQCLLLSLFLAACPTLLPPDSVLSIVVSVLYFWFVANGLVSCCLVSLFFKEDDVNNYDLVWADQQAQLPNPPQMPRFDPDDLEAGGPGQQVQLQVVQNAAVAAAGIEDEDEEESMEPGEVPSLGQRIWKGMRGFWGKRRQKKPERHQQEGFQEVEMHEEG